MARCNNIFPYKRVVSRIPFYRDSCGDSRGTNQKTKGKKTRGLFSLFHVKKKPVRIEGNPIDGWISTLSIYDDEIAILE